MKKNKGFTLIELLAVIVILSVIMVIAVPKILDVIENSKRQAAKDSIALIKDTIKTQIASSEMMGDSFTKGADNCYLFDFDSNNDNVEKLGVKNKDKVTGSIKYCSDGFKSDTLAWDDERVVVPKVNVCETANTVICTLEGRQYIKKYADPAYIGYFYTEDGFTGPVLVGKTANSVVFESIGLTMEARGPFEYKGETWYYSDIGPRMFGNITSTEGDAIKLSSGIDLDAAKELIDKSSGL